MRIAARLALMLLGASCGRLDEVAERDRMLHALDALRDAPSDALTARQRLLANLEATPATTPGVVRARDACVHAYRPLLAGAQIERELQAELQSDAGAAAALLPRVIDAESKIKQSATLMPDCELSVAELRLGRR